MAQYALAQGVLLWVCGVVDSLDKRSDNQKNTVKEVVVVNKNGITGSVRAEVDKREQGRRSGQRRRVDNRAGLVARGGRGGVGG